MSPELKQQLWQDYKKGVYGELFMNTGRGATFQVTDKNQVIAMLVNKLPYSTDPLTRIVQDYTAFKAAWKTYQDKKK